MNDEALISSPGAIKIFAVFIMVVMIVCAVLLVIIREQSFIDIITTSNERGQVYRLVMGAIGISVFVPRYLSPAIKELLHPTNIYLGRSGIRIDDIRIAVNDFDNIHTYSGIFSKGLVVPIDNSHVKINMILQKMQPAELLEKLHELRNSGDTGIRGHDT